MGDCKICTMPTTGKLKHCRACIETFEIGKEKAVTQSEYWEQMRCAETELERQREKFIAGKGRSRLDEFEASVEECMRCKLPFCSTWKGHRHCTTCAARLSHMSAPPAHRICDDWGATP